ncbi:hypothetical protein HPB52_022186 [Rhipicephalus sanguineus]|uniref:Uncharacterized protein n=1 Tax=Rhipicephalus sanguineus TaxID=34632 RepID=A0A9D4SWX4_RHISA|nr:hypothetical protein HPB52_022186 [Rhipicephalus sanguineus]
MFHRSFLQVYVPPGFEHLHSGALGRVKDYVHRAKRRQHIVPLSAKLCRLPLALRQQDAIELRRLQDDDGRGIVVLRVLTLPFTEGIPVNYSRRPKGSFPNCHRSFYNIVVTAQKVSSYHEWSLVRFCGRLG